MNLNLQASLWAQAKISWDELANHFKFPIRDKFPLPLPTGDLDVEVFIEVEEVTSPAPPKFRVRLEADFEINPDGKSFLGFALGRACHFTFESAFALAADLESAAAQFAGKMTVEIPVKLPTFPNFDWLHLHTGDDEGWMKLRISVDAAVQTVNASFQLHAEIQDVFAADFQLPGITQPTPPLHLELTRFSGDINFTFADKNITGSLAAEGNFCFNPSLANLDVPMARYLEPLLRNIVRLEGTVQGILSLSPDKTAHRAAFELPLIDPNGPDMVIRASLLLAGNDSEFGISCGFKNSNHKVYLFDLLNQ
ncbi:MAG TPA: hypothetical protein VJZ27_11815, partial [Aggregatilineales bacterium]|nr:hypothetical protein [Aggregatilineales bacterium]